MESLVRQIRVAVGDEQPPQTGPMTEDAPRKRAWQTTEKWSVEARKNVKAFDGREATLADLIGSYLSEKESPYHKVRHSTRKSYDSLLKRISEDHGREKLSDLRAGDFNRFYE